MLSNYGSLQPCLHTFIQIDKVQINGNSLNPQTEQKLIQKTPLFTANS